MKCTTVYMYSTVIQDAIIATVYSVPFFETVHVHVHVHVHVYVYLTMQRYSSNDVHPILQYISSPYFIHSMYTFVDLLGIKKIKPNQKLEAYIGTYVDTYTVEYDTYHIINATCYMLHDILYILVILQHTVQKNKEKKRKKPTKNWIYYMNTYCTVRKMPTLSEQYIYCMYKNCAE